MRDLENEIIRKFETFFKKRDPIQMKRIALWSNRPAPGPERQGDYAFTFMRIRSGSNARITSTIKVSSLSNGPPPRFAMMPPTTALVSSVFNSTKLCMTLLPF